MRRLAQAAKNKTALILAPLTLILAGQIIASRAVFLDERLGGGPALRLLPTEMRHWAMTDEYALDPVLLKYLKPDDYITRRYEDSGQGNYLTLFVGYFQSLQNSYGPHSPRVCLPGHGWLVRASEIETIAIPGRNTGIPANRYIMEKDDDQIVVFYWYQNSRRVWAEEFHAKLHLLPDLIRYRRSDVSLVRIVAPTNERTHEATSRFCRDFAATIVPHLEQRFASLELISK